MVSSARIFFAGIGTTFIIIAAGFGGGLMFAKSALHDTPAVAKVAKSIDPVRVILPTTAEAAEVKPVLATESSPLVSPKEVEHSRAIHAGEAGAEKAAEAKKSATEERARRKRYAERKARKLAESKARQQIERQRPEIMAFGNDEPKVSGFFNN
jgi:hypothetical protein